MGAATRASTSAAVEALAAVKRPPAELGDQLLAATRAVASSRQLVSVLVDPGVPGKQRAALLTRVLGKSVGRQARTVLENLAAARWSDAGDLVGAMEEVGFRALAEQRTAEALEPELFAVRRAVTSDGRLELALGNQGSPVEARLSLVDTLLKDANPATVSIVRHVVQLPRGRKPAEALARAQAIVADASGRLVATVQVARPLTGAQSAALAAHLESGYGRKISINQVVDPGLVGGIRVTVGDDVIDGTVRARLDDLRLRIAG